MSTTLFKKIFFLILVFAGMWFQPLSAEIIDVDSLQGIKNKWPQLNQNSLVLFDVDYTLIIPNDAILRPCGQKLKMKFVSEILENQSIVPDDKYPTGYLHSEVLRSAKSSLVDERLPGFVRELQEKKIPTLALTALSAGKLGLIECMEAWRIDELKSFGIDFSLAFPKVEYLEFPKRHDKEFAPVYMSGVLFSSKHHKGDVLQQFLERINWHPTKVVFIDDRMEYLNSVEKTMRDLGIDFLGFHFTAAEKLPCHLDEKLAELQFRHLAECGQWLSDQDARNLDKRKLKPCQIIYLNGPSSAGKSTLAKALQKELDEPFLHIGIDRVIGMMPAKLNDWEGGPAPLGFSFKTTFDESGHPLQEIQMGPFAQKISATLKEIVLTMAKMGHFIIIDDVAFGKKEVDKWRSYLKGYPVLWVGIHSPLSVLEEREKERGNRIIGSARSQFYQVHKDVIYDLEFDTSRDSFEKIVGTIKDRSCINFP